jgi:hypothetical protein
VSFLDFLGDDLDASKNSDQDDGLSCFLNLMSGSISKFLGKPFLQVFSSGLSFLTRGACASHPIEISNSKNTQCFVEPC